MRSIVVERAGASRLASHLRKLGSRSVLVVTDAALGSSGPATYMPRALECEDIQCRVFRDVQPRAQESIVEAAAQCARVGQVDCIVGLGGGSSLDTAKIAALLARSGESLADVCGVDRARGPRLSLVLVPTTAGGGAEVSARAVVTRRSGRCDFVVSPHLLADVALLDATLTTASPPEITAATGIAAMIRAIEAFTSPRLKNPISDSFACRALDLLASNVHTACHNPDDIEARERMLTGACLAGMAFGNAPAAVVQALAHPLGAHFRVSDGVADALVFAQLMRFNLHSAADLYAHLAGYVLPGITGTVASRAALLIAYFEALPRSLGLPARLRDVGAGDADIEQLAADAMNEAPFLATSQRELALDDVRGIYRATL
ncbi:iron-containing alcohol dehydrogenase [Paraburkholderia sp. J76]|uniref:iron-containing alcohol dehydrogenase n=1 Tax=Paraburkholderia sp. J76 TaxID=2805439 RepID=UPI002ABDC522|nr:iron-containing alcohol dehydrogenase [Paraburkholderia sp. J76]